MLNTTESQIKIVRLQSGEDIIADCTAIEDSDTVLLNRPMHIIFKRVSTGRSVMMMMPWLPIELIKENSAIIYEADILTVIDPKDDLVEYYSNAVCDEDVKHATESSIRPQLFDNDDDDDDSDADDERVALWRKRERGAGQVEGNSGLEREPRTQCEEKEREKNHVHQRQNVEEFGAEPDCAREFHCEAGWEEL